MSSNTLTVSPGVELAYIDSGAPKVSPYTTIFAIHGLCFPNTVFKKLQVAAFAKGFRFVAINRRAYGGSTPYNGDEINFLTNVDGNAEKRAAFIEARGHEIANFIDIFAQKFHLPSVSTDGTEGGSILFGWSFGSCIAAAGIAYAPKLPADVRSRLSSQIRSFVVFDVSHVFGLPYPERTWTPVMDATVPEQLRFPMFAQWVTGYFDNGDYSKRDLETLEYMLPSTDEVPTIFKDGLSNIASYGQEAIFDISLLYFGEQLKTTFYKAFRRTETSVFPNLKTTFICTDRSPSFALACLWATQDALKEIGDANDVNYKIEKGANHFLHWENPERALELITDGA